jgi:hypothetical protein
LTDNIIYQFNLPQTAKDIVKNIETRHIYKMVYETFIDVKDVHNYNKTTDKYEILDIKVGFVNGSKKNPLDTVYVYDPKTPYKYNIANFDSVIRLKSDNYQERLVRMYSKDIEVINYSEDKIKNLIFEHMS